MLAIKARFMEKIDYNLSRDVIIEPNEEASSFDGDQSSAPDKG